ncbi:hypothetical protein B8281_15940 [Cellulosimicrobium sp. TH-20]|nr:hypothetical protein B8281_15940 [Cellulosimicrobium sp. TH-20]
MGALHELIAEDLRARIDAGEWFTGEKLPGVHVLMTHYSTSFDAVRAALQLLQLDGVVRDEPTSGWWVTSRGSPWEVNVVEALHAAHSALDRVLAAAEAQRKGSVTFEVDSATYYVLTTALLQFVQEERLRLEEEGEESASREHLEVAEQLYAEVENA